LDDAIAAIQAMATYKFMFAISQTGAIEVFLSACKRASARHTLLKSVPTREMLKRRSFIEQFLGGLKVVCQIHAIHRIEFRQFRST
jgi:hypothetical protein